LLLRCKVTRNVSLLLLNCSYRYNFYISWHYRAFNTCLILFFNNWIICVNQRKSRAWAGNSLHKGRDGTACAVVNQLWACLFQKYYKIFSLHKQPLFSELMTAQAVDPLPLCGDFPGLSLIQKTYRHFWRSFGNFIEWNACNFMM
jgi:hypothetical protein